MFEAVIFDLDGLLADTENCQLAAWNEYLRPYDVRLDESEASALVDRRDFDTADLLRRRYSLDLDPLTMVEERQEILLRLVEESVEPRPGALEVVDLLKDHGLRLAIVSAGMREYIYAVTDKFHLEEAFDVIVAGDMIDVSKPNPMPFLACAETFAVHPSVCLVLDDARNGVEAAINADMKVICVPGPQTERWRITGANVVLNSLDDLSWPLLRSIWDQKGPGLQPQRQLQPEPRFRRY